MNHRVRAKSLDQSERQVMIYRDDRIFAKNPDVVLLPSGKMLCVFNETDYHWPTEFSRIKLLESTDYGKSWNNFRIIDEAYSSRGEERWVTPRISRLSDGRLVIICDHDDFHHCHESQPPGIYAWWSEDEGRTWSSRMPTGIPGIEPDRVRELNNGVLLVGSHYMFRDTQKLGEFVVSSLDGGKTWQVLSIVGKDRVHHFCEGAILSLKSGRLVCIMRENNHNNYPSYVAFSDDEGRSWSKPQPAPFSGDRPFPGQLPDGRVLVTYRNQAGIPGLYAWVGDIESELGYKVSLSLGQPTHRIMGGNTCEGLQKKDFPDLTKALSLTEDRLIIDNDEVEGIRYLLLPPESYYSRVTFRSVLKVEGKRGTFCGRVKIARIGVDLLIGPEGLLLCPGPIDTRCSIDMSRWRDLLIEYQGGKIEVYVDGKSVIRRLVFQDTLWERSYFGSDPGQKGKLSLRLIDYKVDNPTDHNHSYQWQAKSGRYPNQYEIDHWLELDYNSSPYPDHGYSSWVQLPDGQIFVADYTNEDAPPGKAYLKGYYLRVKEL